jgi:hypothetical protein
MTMGSRSKVGHDRVTIQGRWVAIPVERLRDTSIGVHERFLLSLLYSWAGNDGTCRPMQETLAEAMGVHPRTIQAWLKRLKKAGWINIRRSIYGNHYDLIQPPKILTDTIPGSHADTIPGSPHTIPGSHAHAIPGSHASMTKSQHDLESPHTPPTPPEDMTATTQTDSNQGQDERVGELLRKAGVGAWKKLQKKLTGIPYELIERRVMVLIDQGKGPAIIYTSLNELPFEEGSMDEAGPIPMNADYWRSQGFALGGDDSLPLEPLLDLSDPELKEYFEQCKQARKPVDG